MTMIVLVVVVLVVGAAALVIAAELVARDRLRARLVRMCAGVLGTDPAVTIDHRSPVLVQLARRRLSRMDLDTGRDGVGPHAILVTGHALGVAPVPEGLHVEALAATATLRLSWIRHAVDAAQADADTGGMTVRSIGLLPKKRSLVMTVGLPVAFGLGVDIRVVIAVSLKHGRLAFRATDLAMPVSVVPVPLPIAWAIDSWIAQLRPQVVPEALDALTIRALRWEKKAVTLDLTAEETTVPLTA